MPAAHAAAAYALDAVDGDPMTGVCSVGNSNAQNLLFFVIGEFYFIIQTIEVPLHAREQSTRGILRRKNTKARASIRRLDFFGLNKIADNVEECIPSVDRFFVLLNARIVQNRDKLGVHILQNKTKKKYFFLASKNLRFDARANLFAYENMRFYDLLFRVNSSQLL